MNTFKTAGEAMLLAQAGQQQLAALLGLVEDTRENHPQAEAASQLDGVLKGLPFWTAKPRPYLIEKSLSLVGNRRSHLWTAW